MLASPYLGVYMISGRDAFSVFVCDLVHFVTVAGFIYDCAMLNVVKHAGYNSYLDDSHAVMDFHMRSTLTGRL